MFWKKKKEEEEEPSFSEDFGMSDKPVMPTVDSGFNKVEVSPSLAKLSEIKHHNTYTGNLEGDIQLILAKLDTIQHMLDNLNQRVKNIERIAESE